MKNLNVKKIAVIKGYDAGKNGNMLVVVTDKLVPITVEGSNGEERDVEVLICTATIADKTVIDMLEPYVDEKTHCNRIIVVSSKFMKLRNKKQLVLLEIENQKVRFETECTENDNNASAVIWAEINAMEKFGKISERLAVGKARRFRERSERKAASGLHAAYKKDVKLEKKLAKAAKKCGDMEMDPVDLNSFKEVPDPAPAQ